MKRTKRSLSLIVVFALILSLVGIFPVSAAEESEVGFGGPSLKVNGEAVIGDAVIASVDFKVDSKAAHGFALRFIPVGGGTPYGAVRLNPYGWVMMPAAPVAWDGAWMDSHESSNDWSHGSYTDDTVHNLKVRLEKDAGTIDYYLDDVWIYQVKGDLSSWNGWDYIGGACWSTEKDYITIAVKSVVTAKSGELLSDVEVDQKNKEITVSFSETVNAAIDSAVLKAASGDETVALTKKSTSGATTVFTYADELIPDEEYVFVLPEDLAGAGTGHKPASRNTYFTAENNIVIDTEYDEADINYGDKQYDLKKNGAGITGETVILSVDFRVDSRASQGFALRFFPVNGGTPMGAVRLNQNGVILAEGNAVSWAATWLEQYDETNGYAMASYRKDVVNNLKVRLNETKGTVDFYLNDKWIGQRTGTLTGWGGWDRITPVGLEADKEYITYEFKSLVTAKSDELLTSVDVDQNNKEIKVSFSETVNTAINNAVLKRVNTASGEQTVALTKKSTAGATTVFGYADELAPGEEYVLILPEELAGAGTGHKPADRYIYFTAKKDYTITSKTVYDFESDAGSFTIDTSNGNYIVTKDEEDKDVVQKNYTAGTVVDSGDASHGKAIRLDNVFSHKTVDSETGNVTSVWGEYNWNGLTGAANQDITAFSFDIKPIKADMQVTIRIKDGSNKTPFSLALGKSGYILGAFNWLDKWSTNISAADLPANSRYEWYVGDYNTDEWTNVRMEYDRVNGIARIYINGDLAKQYEYTNYGSTDGAGNAFGLKWASFVLHCDHMTTEGEQLLLLDNVQTEVVQRYVNVNKVSFTDAAGKTSGAYQVAKSAPSTIALTFNEDVALSNTASDKIKLYYGKQEISYTAAYDKASKCYTMTPASSAAEGQKISVKVDGLTVGEKAVENYTAYITMSGTEAVTEPVLAVVDGSGAEALTFAAGNTYYAELLAANNTGAQQTISVIVAQYDANGVLLAVDTSNIYPVGNGETLDVKYNSEENISITPVTGAEVIKVFAWDDAANLGILCNAAELEKAE